MGKHLTSYQLGQLKAYRDSKPPKPYSQIATILKCDKSTCIKAYHRIKNQHEPHRKKGSGRKRITTPRDDRHMIRLINNDPYLSNNNIRNELKLTASQWTIGRRLREKGYRSYWSTSKPFINPVNKQKRLKFSQDHSGWTLKQWKHVLFSDEKSFTLRFKQRQRVRRKQGNKFKEKYLKGTIKHDKKINVWLCFSYFGKGSIYRINGTLTAKKYHNILQRYMIPSLHKISPINKAIFQQDNDPKHTSNLCRDYLMKKMVKTLPWPSQSPDLNPMENAFDKLDKICKDRRCKNEDELFNEISNGWKKLNIAYLRNLVRSMPRRMRAVIQSRGAQTKY